MKRERLVTEGHLLSTLEYHSYAVLIAHMTSEPCRQTEPHNAETMHGYFTRPNREFADRCDRYLKGIFENAKALHYKNPNNIPPQHLYNPASFIAFGSTDNLSIATLDDFDFVVDITSQLKIPVRQVSLAFVPKVSSLGVDRRHAKWLCEMHDICGGPRRIDRHGLPQQPFLRDRCLCAATYYRLNGLAAIGPGLLFQEAIFQAIAETIGNTLANLKPLPGVFDQADINSFRCTILDPQGWPDVATFMVCRNYSVIAAALLALQTITFQQVYRSSGKMREGAPLVRAVKEFAFYEAVDPPCDRSNQRGHKRVVTQHPLANNRIFVNTCTTTGITHDAFLSSPEQAAKRYSGVVAADPLIGFGPDQLHAFIREYSATPRHTVPLNSVRKQLSDAHQLWWVLFGRFDATEKTVYSPDCIEAIELRYLIERIKNLRGWKTNAESPTVPWFIDGLQTEFAVPIARSIDGAKVPCVHIVPTLKRLCRYLFEDEPLRETISKTEQHPEQYLSGQTEERSTGKYYSPLSLRKLRDAIRSLRIPAPLSSAIVYVFIDYAKSLSDADLFDNVLDLHELFWAFHRALTEEMTHSLQRAIEDAPDPKSIERRRLGFLSADDLRELTDVVSLLESALHNRIEQPLLLGERWHTPFDFHGEMNKLFNAADVPLKCGLSILRRILHGEFCVEGKTELYFPKDRARVLFAEKDKPSVRARVGGGSRLTYYSGAVTRRFWIGEREINFLSELRLNIGHLVRPDVLYAHIHEVGHMICDILVCDNADKRTWCPRILKGGKDCGETRCFRTGLQAKIECDPDVLAERDRLNELFPEVLGCGLIFADYVEGQPATAFENRWKLDQYRRMKTYLRHYIAGYSLDAVGTGATIDEVRCKLAEVVTRGFLACYPFIRPKRSMSRSKGLFEIGTSDNYELVEEDIKRATALFRECLRDARQFDYELDEFLEREEERNFIERHFAQAFRDSYRPLCCIWEHANRLLMGVFFDFKRMNPGAGIGTNPYPQDHWTLVKDIYEGYRRGRPVIRLLYDDPRRRASRGTTERHKYAAGHVEKTTHLDALFVVRHFLRFHLHELFGRMDNEREVYYLRETPLKKAINEQLIDKFDNTLFSVSFKKRAKYMRSRIALIKTFWDLSANIRGRTLRRILRDVSIARNGLATDVSGAEQGN